MASTPRQRLVRRTPLLARVKAYLDPADFLLWAAEELNSHGWEESQRQWAPLIGFALNVVFIVARSNSTAAPPDGRDVFADYDARPGAGWLTWLASFVVHLLTVVSLVNAVYTFTRKRQYRLFESNVDVAPSTPSARRVRVDSSPLASSPMRFFSSMLAATGANQRAHPDAGRDVWEVAVWDPTPVCLRLFSLFSPGHVLVYMLFLPVESLDPRPSITVVKTLFLALLLTVQLMTLSAFFSQQIKDSALIHREVLHEYDTKYVHPALNKPVRDISTQTPPDHPTKNDRSPAVLAWTPTTYVNRGFLTNANQNYATHFDPDGAAGISAGARTPTPRYAAHRLSQTPSNPNLRAASSYPSLQPGASTPSDFSSPLRAATAHRQPQARPASSSSAAQTGGNGSLGVYAHAYSPLKRPGSPLKRSSVPAGAGETRANGSAVHVGNRLPRGAPTRR